MTDAIKIIPIPRTMIGPMWPHVAPHLFSGLTSATDLTLEQIADDLVEGHDTIWAIFDGGKVVGAFLTATFDNEDDGTKFIGVYALGGDGLPRWGKLLGDTMEAHAKSTGVKSVRFSGRDAWSRVLPAFQIRGRRWGGTAIFERIVA